jgi:hypothetical protein
MSYTAHQFHIPVLGLCYSIDTPLKVARFGISSVLSIVEDQLIEDMRAYHSVKNNLPFDPIPEKDADHRAKRITAYLNLLSDLVKQQAADMQQQDFTPGTDLTKYFELLPDNELKQEFVSMMQMPDGAEKDTLKQRLKNAITVGDIDVNIMVKLNNPAYDDNGEKMPEEYSDALSALRGFANSNLTSSIVLSAGYNPALFTYAEQFNDFYPGENNSLTKKIIIKVSDYRSALVQGKLCAKKGLWVSEFRIESGLNCGGHAFPTDGILMGTILEEFKINRQALAAELYEMCNAALIAKGKTPFSSMPTQKVTAQGGVGTAAEHQLLLHYYELDAVGWGSPFLLVPEVTNVDDETLQLMANAEPDDYLMNHASPLGVMFNNFRKSSAEAQRKKRIADNRAGSPCYRNYLASDTEFTERPICTASRQYQQLKRNQLAAATPSEATTIELHRLNEKDCLCEGLTASVRLKNEMPLSHKLSAVTICPGPNLSWFSGIFSLKEMTDHIYERLNILNARYRPHMFINELKLYVDYFKRLIIETAANYNAKQDRYLEKFRNNLLKGINYYKQLLHLFTHPEKTSAELTAMEAELLAIVF